MTIYKQMVVSRSVYGKSDYYSDTNNEQQVQSAVDSIHLTTSA